MTPTPHTIGSEQVLARAHEIMREHRIRHLPVLERGAVVGVISQRDLYFLETIKGVDPESVEVSEAMSAAPYLVEPGTPLEEAVEVMVSHKYGCAVVMEGERVKGVFTTTDALTALVDVLAAERARTPGSPIRIPRKRAAALPGRPGGRSGAHTRGGLS